jgi:hypothetical protein
VTQLDPTPGTTMRCGCGHAEWAACGLEDPYLDFLARKAVVVEPDGLAEVPPLHSELAPHQRDGVSFALRQGRAALFHETGLGKTFQQLEWARVVRDVTGGSVLILCPLAVAAQTVREGERFGIAVTRCQSAADVRPGINIANYDRLDRFEPSAFAGVVLDESGILKSFAGATRRALCDAFRGTPYRLCCTATPAPHDYMELGNHADFLGVMAMNEMLQRWFVNDTSTASQSWRLKGHAVESFWNWVSSWAQCVSRPSDLGYNDQGYILPPLRSFRHIVDGDLTIDSGSALFRVPDVSATGMHREKRMSVEARAAEVAGIVAAEPAEPWLVWCDTDYEADALKAAIPEAVEVRGSHSVEFKERAALDFVTGAKRILVSKSRIFGFGMNFQHCARVAFVGVNYSYEQYYQAIRRCWRFGQTREVHAHIVMADAEAVAWATVVRKAEDHERMKKEMLAATLRAQAEHRRVKIPYEPKHEGQWPDWLAA